MAVQRCKDIGCVSAVDAVAIPIEHECIDKVRVGIDGVAIVHLATGGDDSAILFGLPVNPDLIRVGGALAEVVTQPHRS